MTSLETHLFFGRIMKEHSLFLLAGFPACETEFRNKADWFRKEFEKALDRTVQLADRAVGRSVLMSGEIVTEFTEMAECETKCLLGVPIDMGITQAEKNLRAGMGGNPSREMVMQVRSLNRRVLELLKGLIALKERILQEVLGCRLYTVNYPSGSNTFSGKQNGISRRFGSWSRRAGFRSVRWELRSASGIRS